MLVVSESYPEKKAQSSDFESMMTNYLFDKWVLMKSVDRPTLTTTNVVMKYDFFINEQQLGAKQGTVLKMDEKIFAEDYSNPIENNKQEMMEEHCYNQIIQKIVPFSKLG